MTRPCESTAGQICPFAGRGRPVLRQCERKRQSGKNEMDVQYRADAPRQLSFLQAETRNKIYLAEAQRIAKAAESHWIRADTGGIADGGVFAHLLCDAFLALYQTDHNEHWREITKKALTFVHSQRPRYKRLLRRPLGQTNRQASVKRNQTHSAGQRRPRLPHVRKRRALIRAEWSATSLLNLPTPEKFTPSADSDALSWPRGVSCGRRGLPFAGRNG